ncbi:Protein RUPTURED POLLEN GRAIN 1 [Hordeum vulgare]|nr:Protein RUPTURED POLLEN GRAIN 1 [Hordeum vulgare]
MISPDAARNIVGNVISFGLFLSPVPTFWRIIKNKDVEEFKSDPYLATLLNCMLWVFYGILCVIFGSAMYASPLTIMIPNGIGALFGLVLYACYYKSTPKKEKNVKLKCD